MSALVMNLDDSPPPFLFSEEQLSSEQVGLPHQTGVSTGSRLRDQRPDVYQQIVYLLGQGTGIREIKRITKVHHRTIEAVQIAEGESIDTHRKSLGARALRVAAMGVERLEEIICDGSIKPGELAMAVGILIDKGQVLTGGVTARVESIQPHRIADGLRELLAQLPEADAVGVSDTGLGGGNVSAIDLPKDGVLAPGDGVILPHDALQAAGTAPCVAAGAGERAEPGIITPVDCRSVVLPPDNSVGDLCATRDATDCLSAGGPPSPLQPSVIAEIPSGSTSKPSTGGGEGVAVQPPDENLN